MTQSFFTALEATNVFHVVALAPTVGSFLNYNMNSSY
jgi:hypothetical protein